MGAGASVDESAADALNAATGEQNLDAVQDGTEALAENLTEEGIAAAAAGAAAGEAAVTAALAEIPEASKAQAVAIFDQCKDSMTPEQMSAAAADMKASFVEIGDTETGHAIVVAVGSAITTASACAPGVIAVVSENLLTVAAHLPYVGVAAGVLGGIVVAFKDSKVNDKNVETVMLWSASVKDWLILVSGRVGDSGAKSTAPLFEGLQNAVVDMVQLMEQNNKRSRVSKMLMSGAFTEAFNLAKTRVTELKNALRDYLDQEMQDAQEAKLKEISEATMATNEKLESMDSQLSEIKALLVAQAEANAESAAAKAKASGDTDTATEDALYGSIQEAVNCVGKDVPFKKFVMAFETFMLKGADLPAEVKRGLKIAVDLENTGEVSKIAFAKFFRKWQASEMTMDDYLLKLADEAPPELFASISNTAGMASNLALAASKGMIVGMAGSFGDAKELAAQKAAEAKKAASNAMGSAMGAMGGKMGGMFGGKK